MKSIAAVPFLCALVGAQSVTGTGRKVIGDTDWAAAHVVGTVNGAATSAAATTTVRYTQGLDWLGRHRETAQFDMTVRNTANNDAALRLGGATVWSNSVPSYRETNVPPVTATVLSGSASIDLGIFRASLRGELLSRAGFVATPRTRRTGSPAAHLSAIGSLNAFAATAQLQIDVFGVGHGELEADLRLLPGDLFVTMPTEVGQIYRGESHLQVHDYAVFLKAKGRIGPSWSPIRASLTLVNARGGEQRIPVLTPR